MKQQIVGKLRINDAKSGQALPLIALMLVLLIAFVALATDAVIALSFRRLAINAADNAALIATRQMIEARRLGGSGTTINDTIDTLLANSFSGSGATTISAQARYVDLLGNPLGQVTNGVAIPSDARGITVDTTFQIETYFLRLFDQDQLTILVSSTARAGQVGTATGIGVLPLGISTDIAAIIEDNPNQDVILDLRGQQYDAWSAEQPFCDPTYTVTFNPALCTGIDKPDGENNSLYIVGFKRPTAPTFQRVSSCASASNVNRVEYWMCRGSQYRIEANRLGYRRSYLNDNAMHAQRMYQTLRSGRAVNEVILLPVMGFEVALDSPTNNPFDGSALIVVDRFVAVKVISYNSTYENVVVRYAGEYVTAGGIAATANDCATPADGQGRCNAYAINLVKGND